MTHDDFSRCLALVRGYWHHSFDPPVDVIETWETLLLDLDVVQVAAAVQSLAVEGREFAPPPGVIRKRTSDMFSRLPSPEDAYAEMRTQIAKVGSTRGMDFMHRGPREPQWSHPTVGAVVEAMGWDVLCASENPIADRAHFMRLWESAATLARGRQALPEASRRLVDMVDLRLSRALTEGTEHERADQL